jgi:hypothetical protein
VTKVTIRFVVESKRQYMEKIAYWFLDAVVEARLPVRTLVIPNLAEALNRPSHNLDPQSLCAILLDLVQQDYLVMYQRDPHEDKETPFIPSRRDLEEELDSPQSHRRTYLVYGLSALGGAQWETLSSPRWDRFISASYGVDPYDAQIIAQDRQLVQRYFELQQYISSTLGAIIPESLQWDTLQPWEATYWKTLPKAYRLRFYYYPYEEETEVRKTPTWAWEQFSQMCQWYERYNSSGGN